VFRTKKLISVGQSSRQGSSQRYNKRRKRLCRTVSKKEIDRGQTIAGWFWRGIRIEKSDFPVDCPTGCRRRPHSFHSDSNKLAHTDEKNPTTHCF
jgi:hypothetical protein